MARTMSETAERYHESVVTFLKHGALLPARRCRRLFLELLALSTALSAVFYLFKCLALAADAAGVADLYPGLHDMDIMGVSRFVDAWLQGSDHHRLLSLAYLVAGLAVASVAYIATVCAAVVARRYDSGQAQEHLSLFSFLGTVKSNLARPAKIVAVSCVLKAAFFLLLGLGAQVFEGALGRKEVILYPVALVYLLLESVASMAVVVSVAEKPAGQRAVGRACRLVRGRYKELLLYQTAQGVILDVFLVACALVAVVGLPQLVGAGVTFLLLGAREVFSAANVTGYYFACREKEEDKACHVD